MSGQFRIVVASAVRPVLKVLVICTAGQCLKRAGKFTAQTRSAITQILINLLIPCFLFMKLLHSFNAENLYKWWSMPTFVAWNICCGYAIGTLVVRIAGPHRLNGHGDLVLACCTIGNMGMLPLSLADAACSPDLVKFSEREGGQQGCAEEAMAMVAFGLWVAGLSTFTLGSWL
eukprot:CAMPEP_0171996320 /NCGR_PEP_ID=MMETSP1041-20130122/58_1 /TAXON_ID=464988 /ORGANISM="Hemiselmis andersenii, Strain CCMP439" /LENGTH=173 /DNA_ID=CAMNT_0012649455 /DNA_START=84 /DNA_END=602 /DNA_ORIENTATION=-